jgi:hypothetical protein
MAKGPITTTSFMLGRPITPPPTTPLEFTLSDRDEDAEDECFDMPAWFNRGILLLRDDLIAALRSGGVDNIECFDAIVREPDGSQTWDTYKVVNILGLVAAADMARSTATVHVGGPIIDVEFDELVLDEGRAGGALIFRLAEATASIFVHDRLRRHLLAAGFDELTFLPPGEATV